MLFKQFPIKLVAIGLKDEHGWQEFGGAEGATLELNGGGGSV